MMYLDMPMKATRRLLPLIMLCISFCVSAQDVWTLDRCIQYAFEHNLNIKRQSLEITRSENDILKSQLGFVPSVSASVGHNFNWGRSVDLQNLEIIQNKLSQSTSVSANASIAVLDGLSKLYSLKSARKGLEISIKNVEQLKDDISISIVKSYLQILLSQEILQTTLQNFESIRVQRDRTKLLVEAGNQPYSALLDIESQLASERVQVVAAESQLTSSSLALQQLLDLPFRNDFTIATPDIESIVTVSAIPDIEDIFAQALALPVIESAEIALQKSDIELKMAKGQLYPKIHLSASYGTFYSSSSYAQDGNIYPFWDQLRDNINPSIGIGLSIPIFNNWSVKTQVHNAQIAKSGQEIELDLRKQTLYKDIQTAVVDMQRYFREMEAAQINMAAMEESFRYVEEKFNLGALNGTDYTVAKTNLFKAQSAYYQAKYQYIFQTKILDYYQGIPLAL